MNSETEFHKRRRAFVIFKGVGLLIAQEGFSGAHKDLLCAAGIEKEKADEIILNEPRGFALEGNVYFYQGKEFLELSEENTVSAVSFLPQFRSMGLLGENGKAYNGIVMGKPGEVWLPIKEI